jgi:regulator of protease activity HflC (stomatin/prohibitin superfamily)
MGSLIIVVAFACSVLGITGLKIDREYERAVIFRLGRFIGIRGPGVYVVFPFVEERAKVE